MPIRRELRPLYPKNWAEISRTVRFQRAGNRCAHCGRGPHLARVRCLPDGRWFDGRTWRRHQNQWARWPTLEEMQHVRWSKVVLAAAHVDGDPSRSGWTNLKSLCGRCHLKHDAAQHRRQRWITYRMRYAVGDLLLGPYEALRVAA